MVVNSGQFTRFKKKEDVGEVGAVLKMNSLLLRQRGEVQSSPLDNKCVVKWWGEKERVALVLKNRRRLCRRRRAVCSSRSTSKWRR